MTLFFYPLNRERAKTTRAPISLTTEWNLATGIKGIILRIKSYKVIEYHGYSWLIPMLAGLK